MHILKQSFFPSFPYYKRIIRLPFNLSLKYFLSLFFILNIILISFFIWKNNPKRIKQFLYSLNQTLEKFPDDYTIYIKNGSLIASYDRPKFFWLDYLGKKELLLVVDESATPEKINMYDSLSLLTSKELVINFNLTKRSNKLYVLPLKNFGEITINKNEAFLVSKTLNLLIKLFIPLYIIIALITAMAIIFSLFLIIAIYLFLSSFFVFIIFKLFFKRKLSFHKTFQIGMHAVTFPLILNYFLVIVPKINLPLTFKPPFFLFPLAYFILILIFTFAGNYFAHLPNRDKI